MSVLPILMLLAWASPVTIMPLGDSITAGGEQFSSYRPLLAEKLREAGVDVRFVGSQGGDLKHEGYPGKPVEYLAANLRRLYSANPADIILLHAGHNHFAEELPVPGILRSTEEIITTARAINPQVIVLLAKVIPAGKLPKYSYIPELNEELAKLASRLNTARQPVILVDQSAGFDWRTDTIEDKVHPNAAGAAKMARKWFEALLPVLRTR